MTEKTLNTLALILNSFTFGSLPVYTHALTHTCRHTHTHMHTYTNTLVSARNVLEKYLYIYHVYRSSLFFVLQIPIITIP